MTQAVDFAPPRFALIAAAAMMAATFGAAVLARVTDIGASRSADSAIVQSRLLRIVNARDFSATVTDAADGRLLRVAKTGSEDGFIWGAINGLSYGRKLSGVGMGEPYQLVRRADGKLALIDPTTGQKIPLNAFGPDNVAAFARLLEQKDAAR